MERRFGANVVNGRPSGIRPPSNYKTLVETRNSLRPSDSMISQSIRSTTSNSSVRKNVLKPRNMNAPGSGSSVITSRMNSNNNNNNNRRMSGISSNKTRVSNVFGGIKLMSARKSNVTAKLFGTTPLQNRISYSTNSCSSQRSARRSSVIGSRHITENRPLTEKSYHIHCVEKVISFLTQNNYPHQISKRLSSHPTNSDVTKIFEFLFSFIDPRSKVIPLEIEVPKILLSLEYPFAIKKSDFQSFTNGRSLGSLLGTKEWLVDTLNYINDMNVERTFYPKFDGEIDCRQELVKLAISSDYADINFNEDDYKHDPKFVQLRDDLHRLAESKFGTDGHYADLCNEEDMLKQELQRLDNEMSSIKDLPNSIQTYREENEKLVKFINEMEEYFEKKESESLTLQKEGEEKCTEKKRLEERKRELRTLLDGQDCDAEQLQQQKALKEQQLKKEAIIVEGLKKDYYTAKTVCSELEDKIKNMKSDANSRIDSMTELVNSRLTIEYTPKLMSVVTSDEWIQMTHLLANDINVYDCDKWIKLWAKYSNLIKMAAVEDLCSHDGRILVEQQNLDDFDMHIDEEQKNVNKAEKDVNEEKTKIEIRKKEVNEKIVKYKNETDINQQKVREIDSTRKRSDEENDESLGELQQKVKEREEFYRKESDDILNKWKQRISTCDTGVKAVVSRLDQFANEAENTNKHLNKILAKTISTEKLNRNKK